MVTGQLCDHAYFLKDMSHPQIAREKEYERASFCTLDGDTTGTSSELRPEFNKTRAIKSQIEKLDQDMIFPVVPVEALPPPLV